MNIIAPAILCVGIVGNIQVVKISNKTHFIKDTIIDCTRVTQNVKQQSAYYNGRQYEPIEDLQQPAEYPYYVYVMTDREFKKSGLDDCKYFWIWKDENRVEKYYQCTDAIVYDLLYDPGSEEEKYRKSSDVLEWMELMRDVD
jgi:hypothetical protein